MTNASSLLIGQNIALRLAFDQNTIKCTSSPWAKVELFASPILDFNDPEISSQGNKSKGIELFINKTVFFESWHSYNKNSYGRFRYVWCSFLVHNTPSKNCMRILLTLSKLNPAVLEDRFCTKKSIKNLYCSTKISLLIS